MLSTTHLSATVKLLLLLLTIVMSSSSHFTKLSPSEWKVLLGPAPKMNLPSSIQGSIEKDDNLFSSLFTNLQNHHGDLKHHSYLIQDFLKDDENGLKSLTLWTERLMLSPLPLHELPGGVSVLQYQAPISESQFSILLPQFKQLIEKGKEKHCTRHIAAFNALPENICEY